MSIISNMGTFFRSLVPSLSRKDIKIELAHSFEEIDQTIQPMYSISPLPTLVGKTLEDTTYHFKKEINNFNSTTYKTIAETIDIILDNEDAIEAMIAKDFTEENLKVIADYYKLNILKYIEMLAFFIDYSRRWLNSVVFETVVNVSAGLPKVKGMYITTAIDITSPTFKKDIQFVTNIDNITVFATAVNMLAMPLSKFLSEIKDLEGHTYSDDDWSNTHNPVSAKLDPFHANFITPYSWNMYLLIGKMLNGLKVKRHERNKADVARLQLMLMAMEQEKTVNTDPKRLEALEKQINYYSNLVNKLSAEIEEMERA